MNHRRHKVWPQPAKSHAFETMSCCTVPLFQLTPPPPPLQPPIPVDPVDLRDWEDYGIDPDAPYSPQHAHDIDIALAAGPAFLLKPI